MNERAILLVTLRIGIILLVSITLYDASFLISILLNWQDATERGFYVVNAMATAMISNVSEV